MDVSSKHSELINRYNSAVSESSKVLLGGQGPTFRKPDISDSGKVRLGGQGPIFR